MDPYSTAIRFGGWKGRGPVLWLDTLPPNYEGLFAWLPRSWLLTVGWRRHGLLSLDEAPGGQAPRRRGHARPRDCPRSRQPDHEPRRRLGAVRTDVREEGLVEIRSR